MASQRPRSKGAGQKNIEKHRERLLGWYDRHGRILPWRVEAGKTADPYAVWLSEIMCQQTTVQAVKPYYLEFLRRWPTVFDLAAAPEGDVMAAWAGLGYYARARNLHRCAAVVASTLSGIFPDNQAELKKLPGIGEYTSAAIAAIAFNCPATVVDGNVERVMARFFAITEPLPGAKKKLKDLASWFFDGFSERPGDLAQSFMDLGATVCIPKAPRCGLCPLQDGCKGRETGMAAVLPAKTGSGKKPQRYGQVYWIEDPDGYALFQKRPAKGPLAGMIGLPTSEWTEERKQASSSKLPELSGKMEDTGIRVLHTFTHFDLTLALYRAEGWPENIPEHEGFYRGRPETEVKKMPSVFQKVARMFIDSADSEG